MEKNHARTMMCSKPDKAFNMNAHHVPLRQIVVELKPKIN